MKWQFLIFFTIFTLNLNSQCGLNRTINIIDLENELPDTTNISLLVAGAVQNDLSSSSQGLCGIQIKFRHPVVKELFLELVSPSGQVVRLVGGNITPYNTPIVTWDVSFVPCSSAASPDPGFTDVWENDQDWLNLTTYTGAYYPHQGCLEDFNSGSVNGTWTIRCIDNLDFGVGKILSFNLIFCEDAGIGCDECKLDPGVINNEDKTYCEGDTSLNLVIDKVFPIFPLNDTSYNFQNIIFKDTVIYQYTNASNLTSFASGTYKICGLQIAKLDESKLPAIGSTMDQLMVSNYLFTQGLCGSVSDSCMTIIIQDSIPSTSRFEYLCAGDTLQINGQSFFDAGLYKVVIPGITCDTVINLEIEIIDFEALVSANIDTLTCLNKQSILNVFHETSGTNSYSYNWFTPDGAIESDLNNDSITVSDKGLYCISLAGTFNSKTCIDTLCKQINVDDSSPVLSLISDTLNCKKDTAHINPGPINPLFTLVWSSPDGFDFLQIGNEIKVWNSGKFSLTVSDENGCEASDTIFVPSDFSFQAPIFNVDTLTCKNDSVRILVLPEINKVFNYTWSNVDIVYTNAQNPFVRIKGDYRLEMEDISSGCIQNYDVEVFEDKEIPIITKLSIDSINCLNSLVTPVLISDQSLSKYLWQGPSFSSDLANPLINNPGQYFVTITSEKNGCQSDSTFIVVVDTLLPNLILTVDFISCLVDSTQINVTSTGAISNPVWTGPNGFQSSVLQPFIKEKGVYSLGFFARNGCKGSVSVEAFNSANIPFVEYSSDSITCLKDTVKFNLINKNGTFSYDWTGPGLIEHKIEEPSVVSPGTYSVKVSNDTNGCNETFEFEVIDNRIYSVPIFSVESLSCAKDSTQIMLSNTDVLEVQYISDGFASIQISPFVKDTGWYYLVLTNSVYCTSFDSIYVGRNDSFPIIAFQNPSIGCKDDSVSITGFSNILGTTFHWTGPNGFDKMGSSVFTSVGGNYSLTGTAPSQCKTNVTFEVLYDTLRPVFTILPPDTLTCKKTNIDLTTSFDPSKGKIQWFPSGLLSSNYTVDSAGTYYAQVTSLNGCLSVDSVVVVEEKVLPTFSVTSTIINCKDLTSSVVVSPISNYKSIIWKNTLNPTSIPPNVLNFSTSFPGTFYFSFENEASCIADGNIEVKTDITKPKILGLVQDSLSCNKSSVEIGVVLDRDGIEFLWNGPGVNDTKTDSLLTVTDPGDYYLLVTGTNFCKEDTIISVVNNNIPTQFVTFTDTITCVLDSVTIGVIQADDQISYLWEGPEFTSELRTPKVFAPGIYTVTVTNITGCTGTSEVVVLKNGLDPVFSVLSSVTLPCDSSAIKLIVTTSDDISKYEWTLPNNIKNLSDTLSTNLAGLYSIQLTGENGCISEAKQIDVEYGLIPPGLSIFADSINCKKTSSLIKAIGVTPNLDLKWITPSGNLMSQDSFTTSEGGLFKLIIQNEFKCRDSLTFILHQDTLKPSLTIQQLGEIQCEAKKVTLDANSSSKSSFITSNWSTVGGHFLTSDLKGYSVDVDSAGTYSFELVNIQTGCKAQEFVKIEISPQQFTEIITVENGPSCAESRDGSIEVTSMNGFPEYTILFNGSNVGNQSFFKNLSPGQYTINVTDQYGCKLSKNILLETTDANNISLDNDVLILFGDSILLKPEFLLPPSSNAQIEWYKGSELLCSDCEEVWVRPFVNTIYTLKYSVDGKCKQSFTVLVRVKNFIHEAVPNVFSPSSVSGNNLFYVPQIRGIEKINYIKIFGRWAENVYYQKDLIPGDPSLGWDGRFKNKDAETGVYVVLIEFVLADGIVWKYEGDVLLIR